jgi:hypothetical protein
MYVRGCKCKNTTCHDRATEDILNAPDNNLEEIEPRNAVTSMTAPVAPSKHELVLRTTEAAGAADASTRQVVPRVSVPTH